MDVADLTVEDLRAIAERHDLRGTTFTRLPQVGVINSIYALGDDFVLRVPRDKPGPIAQARAEALAAPAARAAGVRTPLLVAYDEGCDLLPVPYMVYERVHGRTLGLLDWEPAEIPQVWRDLGHDLALLHSTVSADGPAGALRTEEALPDPRVLAEERADDGWFTTLEARWIIRWLDRLAPAVLRPIPRRMLHLDVQATNVMVDHQAMDYRAVLDWGCAGWGDEAFDFFGLPLRAAPFVLEGHRGAGLVNYPKRRHTGAPVTLR